MLLAELAPVAAADALDVVEVFPLPALRLHAGGMCACSNNGRSSQACSGDFKQSARGGLTRLIKRAAC